MELFLLRGTSFVESVADGFVQDCSFMSSNIFLKSFCRWKFYIYYRPNHEEQLRIMPLSEGL